MYDKDEINAISILYSIDPTEEHFEMLLKVLMPLIDKILLRHPQVKEHWEDLKQEMLFKFWGNYANADKLKRIFEKNIPFHYFYFEMRNYAFRMGQTVLKEYDMYNKNMESLEDLETRKGVIKIKYEESR